MTKVEKIKGHLEEIEKREYIRLQRDAGTDIRLATIKREALTAPLHMNNAQTYRKEIYAIAQRISQSLQDSTEIINLFTKAVIADDKEFSSGYALTGITTSVTELIRFSFLIRDIDYAIMEYTGPIKVANESMEVLRSEGIKVGDPIPLPYKALAPYEKVLALGIIAKGLSRAISYFRWLNGFRRI